MGLVRFHFEPLYRSEYGLSRAAWRRLSGIEKVKVIQNYRDRWNAEFLKKFLETDDPEYVQSLPFPPDRKFEPIDPIPDEERGNYY